MDKYLRKADKSIQEDVQKFDDMTLATCVLLIEVSKSDDTFDEQENNKIISIKR